MINDPKRDWLGIDPEYYNQIFVMVKALMKQFQKG